MPLPSPLSRSQFTRPQIEWLRSRDPNDGTPTPPPAPDMRITRVADFRLTRAGDRRRIRL